MDERTFSTSEAAALLDLTPEEVRGFARAGLEAPARGERNEYRFGFRDLVVLRMAARLRRAEVPTAQIERVLARLRRGLDTPLAGLRLEALGTHVVVRDGEVVWRADSDQLQLSLGGAAGQASAIGGPAGERPAIEGPASERSAIEIRGRDAFASETPEREVCGSGEALALAERAGRLEEQDPDAARALYERAARIDPACWEALVGLGFLRQERGDLVGAVDAYERAQALDPDPTVGFNLGLALDTLGRPRAAIAAYQAALALDPRLSDAHYNLSLLHERRGDRSGALRHMIAYRKLTREG